MPEDLKTGFSATKHHWLITIVGFLLLVISLLVAFGIYINEKNQEIASPLDTAVEHIEFKTTEVHQWIENGLENKRKIDFAHVWFQLDRPVSILREMLAGDHKIGKTLIPGALNRELTALLNVLDDDIAAYKEAVAWRANNVLPPGADAYGRHDYRQYYAAMLGRLDQIDTVIQLYLQRGIRQFRKLMIAGIGFCFVLAALIAITFRRFLNQKAIDYRSLNLAYAKVTREIQERKIAEEALQQSGRLLRTVFETSPDAIVITRVEDSVIVDVNPGFIAYTGYDRSEVIGRSVPDVDIWQNQGQREAVLAEVVEK
ncbi:MAG: PAS domain S-box protein, partial [Desulfobacterales bacterium]